VASKSGRTQGREKRGNGFSRETNLRRGVHTREERRSVLIVSNGSRTEVDYFKALRNEPWVMADKVTPKFEAGAPAAVVERASEIRVDSAYDEAWVVCDVDEFNVQAAIVEATAHDYVELVLSRPCFEVWLILHLKPGCPGFNDATQAGAHLKKFLLHWDKAALRFSDFSAGVLDAADRAKGLGEPPEANPSTAVWRVIESLAHHQ
jgi:RloB-like protein